MKKPPSSWPIRSRTKKDYINCLSMETALKKDFRKAAVIFTVHQNLLSKTQRVLTIFPSSNLRNKPLKRPKIKNL